MSRIFALPEGGNDGWRVRGNESGKRDIGATTWGTSRGKFPDKS